MEHPGDKIALVFQCAAFALLPGVSLNSRQIVHIDSADNKSINLQCGDRAEMLGLVDNGELVAFDNVQQAKPPMKAGASGF
jgi:hypothetical protein